MTKALSSGEVAQDVRAAMRAIGAEARAAARQFANAPAEVKTRALMAAARILREGAAEVLEANARDLAEARAKGGAAAFLDRLALDPARIEGIARGLEEVAALPDPVGRVLAAFGCPRTQGEVPEHIITKRFGTDFGSSL